MKTKAMKAVMNGMYGRSSWVKFLESLCKRLVVVRYYAFNW